MARKPTLSPKISLGNWIEAVEIRGVTAVVQILAGLMCASMAVLGCGEATGGEDVTWHPIIDSLSVDPEAAIRIPQEMPTSDNLLSVFADRLRRRVEVARIGVLEGDSAYIFGQVADAQFLSDGSLAVLDRQARLVRVFDPSGTYRYMVGGPGEGPGEMDFPVALLSPVPGSLWVIEGARGIHRFADELGRLAFSDQLRIGSYSVRDGCSSDDAIVIHIASHVTQADQKEPTNHVLFTFAQNGNRTAGFAVPYRYSHRIVAQRMKRGYTTCASAGTVLLGFENQNRLDAYDSTTGRLLWHATFDGMRIPRLRERLRPDGRRAVGIDVRGGRATYHFLLGVAGGNDTPVVVQFGRRRREDVLNRLDRYVIETYLVDPHTGEGAYFGESLPQVLTLAQDRVVLLHADPYGQVEVARLHPIE